MHGSEMHEAATRKAVLTKTGARQLVISQISLHLCTSCMQWLHGIDLMVYLTAQAFVLSLQHMYSSHMTLVLLCMTLATSAGELYLDYGRGFWDIRRDRLMEIEAWQRELDKMLQVPH